MCLAPNNVNGFLVGCRECWQCIDRFQLDWVGRCIAESKTAQHTSLITLTYGRDKDGNSDHPAAVVLNYKHVQDYFRYLRKDQHRVRYLAVGEYGSDSGRAHWHIVAFWQGKVPAHILTPKGTPDGLEIRFWERHWPHGFSVWQEDDVHGIQYFCKYIQKDLGADIQQGFHRPSLKPPLGDAYFRNKAETEVQQGLPPDLFYKFSEATRNGKLLSFRLQGKSSKNYLQHYIDVWNRERGNQEMPWSTELEEYQDSQASLSETFQEYQEYYERRPSPENVRQPPLPAWAEGMFFHDSLNNWVCYQGEETHVWQFSDIWEPITLWSGRYGKKEEPKKKKRAKRSAITKRAA